MGAIHLSCNDIIIIIDNVIFDKNRFCWLTEEINFDQGSTNGQAIPFGHMDYQIG